MIFNNTTISNGGTIALNASNSELIVEGTVTLQELIDPTVLGSFTLVSGSQVLSNLSSATLINASNIISGAGTIGDAFLTVDNDAASTVDATGMLTINAVSFNNNGGLLEATAGGTLQILGSVSNSGSIEADGGTLNVSGTATVSGSGTVVISNDGTADFAGILNQNVTFSGAGILDLTQSASFGGIVTGFNSGGNSGDIIDLTGVPFAANETAIWTQNGGSGTLQIFTGVTLDRTLNLAGAYTQSSFALTAILAAAQT